MMLSRGIWGGNAGGAGGDVGGEGGWSLVGGIGGGEGGGNGSLDAHLHTLCCGFARAHTHPPAVTVAHVC
jgi:hypothetical protein